MADNQLDLAIARLASGQVVGIPTETVYGLAASILSDKGLRSIFQLKERPFFDPLIVHVSSTEMLDGVVGEWPKVAGFLAQKFWPGPITLVVKRHESLNPLITSGLDTVGVRMPRHDLTLNLIEKLGAPVAAPSANKFGKTSPTRPEHVRLSFPGVLVLDGGPCEVGIESTVAAIESSPEHRVVILRPGSITQEMIQVALGDKFKNVEVISVAKPSQSRASPGTLERHYQPDRPLIVVRSRHSTLDEPSIREQVKLLMPDISRPGIELILPDQEVIAARELYSLLRTSSERLGFDYIYLPWTHAEDDEKWRAIWDRIKRAATHIINMN